MDFSSRAQAKNAQKYFEDFSIIRKANSNIVEAIKTLKYIQINLQRFLASTNQDIKNQYEDIDNNGHYLEKMLKGQLSFYEDSLLQKEFQKMIEKIKNNERLDTDISVSLYQSIENVVNGKALESKHDFLRYFFVQYLRGPRFIDSQKEYFEIIKKENERDINVNFLSIAMVFRLAEQMAIDVDTYYYS